MAEEPHYSKAQIPMYRIKDYKTSDKYDTTKGNNNDPITDPKEREIYELSDKKFRVIFLRKYKTKQSDN